MHCPMTTRPILLLNLTYNIRDELRYNTRYGNDYSQQYKDHSGLHNKQHSYNSDNDRCDYSENVTMFARTHS
jgi:hypothetical protein